LAEWQQLLNMMLHKLGRLAVEVHNLAVVVTNQVQSQPDDFSAGRDGLRAAGGNVMGDARIYIKAIWCQDGGMGWSVWLTSNPTTWMSLAAVVYGYKRETPL